MNKITQTFRQKSLENSYQKNRENYSYNSYKIIAFTCIIITLERLIKFSEYEIMIGIMITSAILLLIVVMSILIAKFCEAGSTYCLVLLNSLLILLQLYQDDDSNEFIMGSNLAIIHCAILIAIDFKFSVMSIVIQSGTKLLIAGLIDQKTDVASILFSIVCPACFLLINYRIEQQKRLQFLNTHQDNDWHQLLPAIMTDPFIMFAYDQDRMYFKFKACNQIDKFPYCNSQSNNEENFRSFIRMANIEKKTIEQFVLTKVKEQHKAFTLNQYTIRSHLSDSQEFEIQILLAELYNVEDNFLLVLESTKQKTQLMQTTKDQLISLINKHQEIVCHFLKKQGVYITNCILNQDDRLSLLYQIKIHHLYFLSKYKISNSFSFAYYIGEPILINFKQIFQTIIAMFRIAYPNWLCQMDITDTNFDVYHNKEMTTDFIVQLLQIIVRKNREIESIRILLHATDELIFIKLSGKNQYLLLENLNRNIVIEYYLKSHSPETTIKINEGGVFVQLYRNILQLKSLNKFDQFCY